MVSLPALCKAVSLRLPAPSQVVEGIREVKEAVLLGPPYHHVLCLSVFTVLGSSPFPGVPEGHIADAGSHQMRTVLLR